ncbi:dynamin family protein [Trichoderma parareesei]|uniref:Dynamin family protein n=1 Tax=Trichoderma parareesei TaxID=858221 RepID=A0A2H2Z9P6_TRIPA|nr:dynamin family protein [Trichoderma parareesei]
MGSVSNGQSGQGLGNRVFLDKIDKLRELNISKDVPLPQMVVVGDQSSGKSSVLESLTGFQFPRAATLCTRHATEIVCRREPIEGVVVSIIPHNPSPEREKLVRGFRRSTDKIGSHDFAKIFEDAARVMGIKLSENDGDEGSAFSLDVLKVEISGPHADHLTVIDVPGMFETVTPGVTTESDIDLVKNMVKRYIEERRTIILAVVPCIVDIANQKILRLAAEVDPDGKRTLGVLTKPDLCIENATKAVVCDLVNGKRRDLHLGYCVVKNLGADDVSGNMHSRNQQEQALFGQAPWNTLPSDRVGVAALQTRIRHLLMDRTRAEFPLVQSDIMASLKKNKKLLAGMGESRSTTDQQRAYVGKVASDFATLKNYGLDAYYTRHDFFDDYEMRLITRVRTINEAFALVMHEKGHSMEFDDVSAGGDGNGLGEPDESDLAADRSLLYGDEFKLKIPKLGEGDLGDIVSDPYWCAQPERGDMLQHIQELYLNSRGYEMGTFSSEMLSRTFKEQGSKWRGITLAHVSNAMLIVHQFIRRALEECCPDPAVREELWGYLLYGHDGANGQKGHEGLLKRYRRAMDNAEFLLSVEFQERAITHDPRFDEQLNKLKLSGGGDKKASSEEPSNDNQPAKEPQQGPSSSLEDTTRGIHVLLQSYYGIARSRFIDVVCQQAIDYFLLRAKNGPLEVLSDKVVLNMSAEQLDVIAGEDLAVKEERERLAKQVESLTQALKILRS